MLSEKKPYPQCSSITLSVSLLEPMNRIRECQRVPKAATILLMKERIKMVCVVLKKLYLRFSTYFSTYIMSVNQKW